MTTQDGIVRLLRQASASGVFRASLDETAAVIAKADMAGFSLTTVDLSGAADARGVQDRLAQAMHFPEWFGYNWDALADCMADLSWHGDARHIIVLRGVELLIHHNPSAASQLLHVLRVASSFWQRDGMPFWVLIVDSTADLPSLVLPK